MQLPQCGQVGGAQQGGGGEEGEGVGQVEQRDLRQVGHLDGRQQPLQELACREQTIDSSLSALCAHTHTHTHTHRAPLRVGGRLDTKDCRKEVSREAIGGQRSVGVVLCSLWEWSQTVHTHSV